MSKVVNKGMNFDMSRGGCMRLLISDAWGDYD